MGKENLKNAEYFETASKNEKYVYLLFSMLKKRESIVISDKETHFKNTEIRLIFEVLVARYEGRRLISTQIAKLLGVTRSAVSQIVNRLEENNIVKRVADDVDRKIAYIELTDSTVESYKLDLEKCEDFIVRVVQRFGEENFYNLVGLFDDFIAVIEQEKRFRSRENLNNNETKNH